MRYRALLLALAIALPARAAAQAGDPDTLAPGSEVRVMRIQAGGERAELMRGRFQRLSGDTLVLALSADSSLRTILVPGHQLERLSGRTSGTGQGAVLGFLVGAVAGGIIGSQAYEPCNPAGSFGCIVDFGPAPEIIGGAALFGVIGGLAGAAIGSLFGAEKWAPVDRTPRVTFQLRPAPLAASFGATLHF